MDDVHTTVNMLFTPYGVRSDPIRSGCVEPSPGNWQCTYYGVVLKGRRAEGRGAADTDGSDVFFFCSVERGSPTEKVVTFGFSFCLTEEEGFSSCYFYDLTPGTE